MRFVWFYLNCFLFTFNGLLALGTMKWNYILGAAITGFVALSFGRDLHNEMEQLKALCKEQDSLLKAFESPEELSRKDV